MLKAIFYKEWIKTKRVMMLITLLAILLLGYMWLGTAELFRTNSAVSIWSGVIGGKTSAVSSMFYYLPVLIGLFLGVVQFVAEITDKRLKLTLHLPKNELKIISCLFAYGVISLLVISILYFIFVLSIQRVYYPAEVISFSIIGCIQYILLGIGLYFVSAWTIIEPIWRKRIFGAVVGLSALYLFWDYLLNPVGVALLVVLDIMLLSGALLSVGRFKDGAQK